jgi:hypothetical protein
MEPMRYISSEFQVKIRIYPGKLAGLFEDKELSNLKHPLLFYMAYIYTNHLLTWTIKISLNRSDEGGKTGCIC